MNTQVGAITENIALLAILKHNAPVATNAIPCSLRDSRPSSRLLTLAHEELIAKAFSLLLVNTNDKSKIGAICIEENPAKNSLIVRTATNSGNQEEREQAFHRIAAHLKNATRDGDFRAQEDELMDDVVAVCQKRLLGRLRSKHTPNFSRGKKAVPLISRLHQAVQLLRKYGCRPSVVARLEKDLLPLETSFIALENLSVDEARGEPGRRYLKTIIMAIERIFNSTDKRDHWLVETLPQRIQELESMDLKNLVERFQKIAQYKYTAKDLLRLARRSQLFRELQIEQVSTGPFADLAIGRDLPLSHRGLLSAHSSNACANDDVVVALKSHPKQSLNNWREEILGTAKQDRRVHAEVQLVLHYDIFGSADRKPRVICSDKMACFLCNAFITAHGGFWMPSTHGTLYPQWRLPTVDELVARKPSVKTLRAFNKILEREICIALTGAQTRPKNVGESVLFLPGSFTPSVVSADNGACHIAAAQSSDDEASSTASSFRFRSNHLIDQKRLGVSALSQYVESSPHGIASSVQSPIDGDQETTTSKQEDQSSPQTQQIQTPVTEPLSTADHTEAASYGSESNRIEAAQNVRILARRSRVRVTVYPDSSTRVHSSRIHLELNYDIVATPRSDETLMPGRPLILLVECDEANATSLSHREVIDLGSLSLPDALPVDALFQENGIAFRMKDELVVVRAVVQH